MAQLDQKKMEEFKQTHCTRLTESMAAMRIEEKSDTTLVCEEKQFFAHRCVLEAASPYFKTMLSCGLQESMSGTITFNCMAAETLEAILDFIYTGKVEHINSKQLLKSVLIASHLLQLEELVQYCDQALALLLASNNFFELLEIGLKYEQDDLRKALGSFWVVNSAKLLDTDMFLFLEITEVKELLNFVKCKSQCLDLMLVGFLHWLRYDLQPREEFIDEFFDCIDAKLVKQQFVQSWLNDETIMTLSKKLANRVDQLSIAVVKSGSEPLSESVLLDVCSWKTKLTYFSQFRTVDGFDAPKNCYTLLRSEPTFCVQQFDLLDMKWLSLQIPESANFSDFRFMYQFGEMIYLISETQIGSYEVRTNCFKIEKLVQVLPLGDGFIVFGGHVYTSYYRHIFYSALGSCHWKKGSTLNFTPNGCTLLASTEYLYVIGDNPKSSTELTVQYNSSPSDECSHWETIHIVKAELLPSSFFIHDNTLNALIGFGKQHTLINSNRPLCGLKQLTYNHSTKKIELKTHEMTKGVTDKQLKLSCFQDYRSPYIFFASSDDNFSIPSYAWQPASGTWTKLPARNGTCGIPNDSSVKLVYSVDK